MKTTTLEEVLRAAEEELAENDRLRKALRDSDARLSAHCLAYGEVMRLWVVMPVHLRKAVDARRQQLAA